MKPARPPKLRVAALGFWHVHAEEYALRAQQDPKTELVAVWDDDRQRGQLAADQLGVEFVADLDALLAREDIDAVTVSTSTALHRDVIVQAARAGKHIFTEKLLAASVAEAQEIVEVCDQNGVVLIVSLPRLYHGYTRAIDEIVRSGKLGRIVYGRVHISHDGALAGWLPERFFDPVAAVGGALADLGCHPVYLIQLFLGAHPEVVDATYQRVTGRALEDHAVVTAKYSDGGIGVIESSFVSRNPFTIEVFGTEGSVVYSDADRRLLAMGSAFDSADWRRLAMPEDAPDAFAQWLGHIGGGSRADDNLARALELTRLVVAADASAELGQATRP